ncbi:MAG: hypothetical protein SV375_18320, partial [Thermodesulfobacteriota bacterium]|nr:hypothetical protein [Thermodesulfobacteriota bacterium]
MLYKFRKMYIPALTIVAVILLLLILISVSTYRNLDRDRRKAISFLQSQGTALIHSLEAVVKVGLGASSKKGFMGNIIREIAKSDDIAYIYFIDSRGEVIHYSGSVQVGDRFATQNIFPHSDRIYSMVRKISKEIRVYELTKSFLLSQLYQTTEYKNEPANEAIVLGLKMKKFEEAQKADLHHAVIMAGILVALGSGILFFIFVIQNYYLVDKTLKETQDYTRQVVAKMANGLLSINAAGELVSYNKLALSLLGLEVKEALGMDLRTVMDFEATGISET